MIIYFESQVCKRVIRFVCTIETKSKTVGMINVMNKPHTETHMNYNDFCFNRFMTRNKEVHMLHFIN